MPAIYGRIAICRALGVADWRSVERRARQGLPLRREPGPGGRWVLLPDELEEWLKGDDKQAIPTESLDKTPKVT